MASQLQALAAEYVEAVGRNDYDAVSGVLDPEVEFRGPYVTLRGAGAYVTALQRLEAVRRGHELRKVFVDGDEVCVIYDFVTDTAADSVAFVEWLTFADRRLRSIRLYFDREQFAPAREALARRARGEAS